VVAVVVPEILKKMEDQVVLVVVLHLLVLVVMETLHQ
jgi:hypothetical protein|tara:strand:- start:358 stop:468 length:111 start_codon:yes stop_codon:yes gene_type:complete